MKRKWERYDGQFQFQMELIKENKKTGCLFALVHKKTGSIKRIIRPNANAFWVNGAMYDLYAVNFDNAQYTTTYKFFPFGRSGRWELMPFQGTAFREHTDMRYQRKYVGPRRGPRRFRRAAEMGSTPE